MEESTLIRIQQLRKIYQMGRQKIHALAGVDLDIPVGSFTVVMGPSGSGKSTMLYLLGGLDRPTSGTILVKNQNLNTMDENTLAIYRRKMLGFVFQQFNLIASMTALENVAFPMRFSGISGRERHKRATGLLQQVGLETYARHRPTEMSGGQQQRVAIARALINNPPIILADEPTGNLDTNTGFAVMQLLSELHKSGRTVVVVTHDARMARFATHVLYILDGKLVSREDFERTSAMPESVVAAQLEVVPTEPELVVPSEPDASQPEVVVPSEPKLVASQPDGVVPTEPKQVPSEPEATQPEATQPGAAQPEPAPETEGGEGPGTAAD